MEKRIVLNTQDYQDHFGRDLDIDEVEARIDQIAGQRHLDIPGDEILQYPYSLSTAEALQGAGLKIEICRASGEKI